MRRVGFAVGIVAAASVIGCTSMSPQQQGTVTGAAIGAAAGAGIAAISGGSGWTGAAIGAVAGGVVGFTAGPSIAHSWGLHHHPHHARTAAAKSGPTPTAKAGTTETR